ncbi:MAG: hypothetical protein QNK15_09870 [Cycloclasticus sp.]|nr:hypothetical protein [Cycloclasticus sp.]
MILGSAAILFNVLSIMTISVLMVMAAWILFLKLKPKGFNQYSLSSQRQLLWLVVLSPWCVGLLSAAVVIFPGSQYFPFPPAYELLHWHHVEEFSFKNWHGLSIMLAIFSIFLVFGRKIYHLSLGKRQLKLLYAFADQDDNGVYQLDADAATAFTAGYFKPRFFITSTLRQQLSNEEYAVVRLHENEHIRCFDPLKKACYQLLAAFYPRSIARQLNSSMALVMELGADSAVSRIITDKSFIALTMIKVRRLADRSLDSCLSNNVLCHYGVDAIEARINYLLTKQDNKIFPFYTIIFTATLMMMSCAFFADFFHHFIEYTLSH